jgi:hypothetical protein
VATTQDNIEAILDKADVSFRIVDVPLTIVRDADFDQLLELLQEPLDEVQAPVFAGDREAYLILRIVK